MQQIPDILFVRANVLIMYIEKNEAFNPKTIPLPRLHINYVELDSCHQYQHLGVAVNDAEFIRKPKKRLWERLEPRRTLVGKGHGVSVTITRRFYF